MEIRHNEPFLLAQDKLRKKKPQRSRVSNILELYSFLVSNDGKRVVKDQQRVAIETLYKAVICNITTRHCTNVGGRNERAARRKPEERVFLSIKKGH